MSIAAGGEIASLLTDGFALALQESLADPRQCNPPASPSQSPGTSESSEGSIEDSASLILSLLIRSAYRPGPNFAHLLLGFDVTDGLLGMTCPLPKDNILPLAVNDMNSETQEQMKGPKSCKCFEQKMKIYIALRTVFW